MGFLNLKFFHKNSTEEQLAQLENKITHLKRYVIIAQLRRRQFKRSFTIYASWIFGFYIFALLFLKNTLLFQQYFLINCLLVPIIPVSILGGRRLFDIYYTKAIESTEVALDTLKLQQEEKLDEFKTQTDYYTIQTLLRKYGNGYPQNDDDFDATSASEEYLAHRFNMVDLYNEMNRSNGSWLDSILELLIGKNQTKDKYALICSHCFNHNGLAQPDSRLSMFYYCPHCGAENGIPPASLVKRSRNDSSIDMDMGIVGEKVKKALTLPSETESATTAVDHSHIFEMSPLKGSKKHSI